MVAILNRYTQVTETLIGHGADVNAKDEVFCQLYIVNLVLYIYIYIKF